MLWRFFRENWALKLFSLGMALALYAHVNIDNGTAVGVEFRIDYRSPQELMITNSPPTLVHATLKGPGARWRPLDTGDLTPVVLDFSRAEPGIQRRVIDLSMITPPAGLKVVELHHAEVEVEFDRRIEHMVPVRADITEAPAFGFEILKVHVDPDKVKVSGPALKMQKLDYITTRTLDVTGQDADLNIQADLRPPSPPLSLLMDKPVVSVFIEIGEEFAERIFQNLPVHLVGAPRGSHLSPATVSLTIKGPKRAVDGLDRSGLEVVVRVAEEVSRGELQFEKAVELRELLPERAQISKIPKVQVRLAHPRRSRRR